MKGRATGFTLLEVMVALVVVSVALGAIIQQVGGYARSVDMQRTAIFAQWVGMNQLAELQAAGVLLASGSRANGKVEMAGRDWQWQQRVDEVPGTQFVRRVTITVTEVDSEAIASELIGYVGAEGQLRQPAASGGDPSAGDSDAPQPQPGRETTQLTAPAETRT